LITKKRSKVQVSPYQSLLSIDVSHNKVNKMENRRRFSRIDTLWEARYFLKERERGWGKCTIIDFSHKGIGIEFHTSEEINVGSSIHLDIFVPKELKTVCVEGKLKWINQRRNDFVGGIEWYRINREALGENKFVRLS
jgi:c-di-GMP-binding flagellar brake protein YcgR